MKLKFLLFFLFVCTFTNAQITDLQKLSKGKFYSSDVIKDVDNNIKGYFLLFETDKVGKEVFELEYVVLDENMNKVINGFMTETKTQFFLMKSFVINVDVSFYRNKLLLRLSDNVYGGSYTRFRILDLDTNKLTDSFIFKDGKLEFNPKLERGNVYHPKEESEEIYFLKDVGLVADTWKMENYAHENFERGFEKTKTRDLIKLDDNFNQVWKTVCEDKSDKKRQKNLEYLDSDQEIMVFFNRYQDRSGIASVNDNVSVPIYSSKTGTLINEFLIEGLKKNNYRIVDVKLTENEIFLFGNFSVKNKSTYIDDTENFGLFLCRLSKLDGKLIESKYLYWKDIGDKLNIDKDGFVKNEGNLFIHNILPLSDGKIIVVCEAFKNDPITTNNMYFFELSNDFKLNQVFEVAKFRNKFPDTNAHSKDIKKYGLYDFVDYQNMGDDEFLFFFNDNEKNAKKRNKSTIYGVVSYSEGKFKRQTIDLKTETSSIKAFPAKKGFITLVEDFDDPSKPTELRLEKINY